MMMCLNRECDYVVRKAKDKANGKDHYDDDAEYYDNDRLASAHLFL
jgi:hypothetical protein